MPGLNSNPSNSNSSARNGITGDETPPRIAYYLNPNTGEVEMVIIPEGAPLPHDPRAASWGFIDWNEAFRAAYHSRDDCPRRGTAGTNGTSGGVSKLLWLRLRLAITLPPKVLKSRIRITVLTTMFPREPPRPSRISYIDIRSQYGNFCAIVFS
ncbi:hypothetical protein K435DRAFT_802476 [Dendrothele bispora CBS 962.96]|uniref:Uncharacterized protein n=1 Tax=Dendrothele bispora (strain CBS 962.96) TaxID=1314807 RepID=A0A4V4HE43_DENBC|nr:hypothetical protein K435DRAFT_802476 [Dendrothele bispora CBS 962.96]